MAIIERDCEYCEHYKPWKAENGETYYGCESWNCKYKKREGAENEKLER